MLGQKYGRLTVQEVAYKENKRTYLKATCDCGSVSYPRADGVKSSKILSCGCLRLEKTSGSKLANELIGKTFNYLTVLEFSHMGKGNVAYVKVICKCGTEKIVSATSIKRHHTTSCGCYNKELVTNRTGELSPRWDGGKTPKNKLERDTAKYAEWRKAVFERDSYTCCKCNKGGKLQAHHLLNFSKHPELRLIIDNGVTLCKACHDLFHVIYGKRNNTPDQYYAFLGN